MASLIGAHFRTNGIKQLPCRAVLSLNGVGLGPGEQHPDTITIVRDTRVFPDGEAPPDWRTYDGSDWPAFGQYWYAIHDAYWQLNPADYYQLTNEQGGGEGADVAGNYEQLVKVERAIMQAANADGRKCAVLNLAGGSPGDFEIWKAICAPFILEAWESGGNLYGRHCYADWFVEDDGSINNGQPQRVINELEYLKSIGYGGGVVLTECGLYGGYGVAAYDYFEQQVTRWEQALRPYADIFIGLCWWECGASEFNADYTAHIKKLLPYIQAGNLPRWTPLAPPPDGGEPPMTKLKSQTYFGTAAWADKKITRLRWQFEHRPEGETGNTYTPFQGEIPLPEDLDLRGIRLLAEYEHEIPDEPTNPNPPPVVSNPLPQGALFADVSANNKVVNLATLKAKGVQGVGIRLSNGIRKNTDTTDANGVDKMAQYYIEEAESLDMAWLGYHFSNENYDDVEQVRHFLGIANQFIAAGHIPEMGLWIDFETPQPPVQGSPTTEDRIELQLTTLATERPSFIGDYGPYTSKGWWDNKVPNAAAWVPVLGLKSWAAAWVPTGTLVNGWPPSWWHPAKLKGFSKTHFWQWTSAGGLLVGHSVASLDLNFVGGTAVVPGSQPPPPTPPPPTGATVDTLRYFEPSGQYGHKLVMKVGEGTQPMQLEKRANDVILRKGDGNWIDGIRYQDSEQWKVSDGQIQKGKDTSDAGNGGKDGYDLGWAQWIPQLVQVGQTYHSTPTVRRFDRTNNCQTTSENVANDYLHIKALVPTWVSPANPNIVLNDVLIVEWRSGTADLNIAPNETYYFCKEYGYVGWGSHFILEVAEGQAPLAGALDCGM